MIGERITQIYSIEEYPLLRIIVSTESGHYMIVGNESYVKLTNYTTKNEGDLPKELKGMIVEDVMSDGEMLVILLENNHYISRSWSFVTGDGQVSQAISFHNDFYSFFEDGEDKENTGFYTLSRGV